MHVCMRGIKCTLVQPEWKVACVRVELECNVRRFCDRQECLNCSLPLFSSCTPPLSTPSAPLLCSMYLCTLWPPSLSPLPLASLPLSPPFGLILTSISCGLTYVHSSLPATPCPDADPHTQDGPTLPPKHCPQGCRHPWPPPVLILSGAGAGPVRSGVSLPGVGGARSLCRQVCGPARR